MKQIRGFTAGAFDVTHAGHYAMFEEAREHCDYLIVGLHTDPTIDRAEKNKPIQSVFERYVQLKACRFIDEIIPYETEEDLINLLHVVKPDVRIIGADYKEREFSGKGIIPHVYNSRSHNYSSSSLRKRLNV